MFFAEINATTRTRQGAIFSTLYRSARCETMADTLRWVDSATRALEARQSEAYVTIRDGAGSLVKHYRWQYDGSPRWCPSRNRRPPFRR